MSVYHDDAAQELDSPIGIVGVSRGGSGANHSLSGPGFWYQAAAGAAVSVVGRNITILSSKATAGSGTPSSPWTGWETAFAALSTTGTGTISVTTGFSTRTVTGVGTSFTSLVIGQYLQSPTGFTFGRISAITNDLSCTVESWYGSSLSGSAFKIYTPTVVYAPAGHYSSAVQVDIPYPAVHFYGDGEQVTHFKFTGTGRGFVADVTAPGYSFWGIYWENFSVEGNANITECIYTDNVTRLYMRNIQAWNCSNAAIRCGEAIIGKLDFIKVTRNAITTGTAPAYGVLLEDCTCIMLDTPIIEALTAGTGVRMNSCDWCMIEGGTIEGNLINLYVDGNYNVAHGVDLESGGTTTHAARITGGDFNAIVSCTGLGLLEVFQTGANTPWGNRIQGGLWNQITIGALCYNTVLENLKYNQSGTGGVTDNGTDTRYRGSVANAITLVHATENFKALRTSGNVGLGVAPSATAGTWLTATSTAVSEPAVWTITSSDATGTATRATVAVNASTAAGSYQAHGAGRVATRFGVTIANYVELNSTAGAGFIFGSTNVAPVIIGANSLAGLILDGTNAHPSFPASHKRVTAQFDKTSDTTLAAITGLSVTVTAAKAYEFEANLVTSSNASGGVKFAISGTATATSVTYESVLFSAGVSVAVGTARAAALGTAVGDLTAVTAARCVIRGLIVVSGAGTLVPYFAQNASFGTASSVLVGSTFRLVEVA